MPSLNDAEAVPILPCVERAAIPDWTGQGTAKARPGDRACAVRGVLGPLWRGTSTTPRKRPSATSASAVVACSPYFLHNATFIRSTLDALQAQPACPREKTHPPSPRFRHRYLHGHLADASR